MRRILASIAFALAAGTVQGDVLFENVEVITMEDESVRKDRHVLVRGDTIVSITEAPPATGDDVIRIDGDGRFLMPGLAEMHAHIPSTANRQNAEDVLFLYLSQGLTTVRGMLGEPGHLELRQQAAAGTIDAPRIYTSGPSLNGNTVESPEQAESMVRAQHAAGYDHIKIHPGLSTAEFDALAATALELDMPFVGHVSSAYGAPHAIAVGMTGIDHLDGFITALVPADEVTPDPGFFGLNHAKSADAGKISEFAQTVAQAGTWVVPTETLMVNLVGPEEADSLLSQPGMEFVGTAAKAQWRQAKAQFSAVDRAAANRFLELRRALLVALHEAGTNIALGSDAPQVFNVPGFSAHRELELYVDAGLSPFEALRTGTVNVGRYFSADRGTVAPGQAADLLLLAANPLEDIRNTRQVSGVMVAGRWYDAATIRAKLEEIKERIR
ncbi:MAG: amidohydrolase family protein [Xanthomonadales bacterium]|nr:amidohydrolase family protein [Xanthomonadales bacterium]